MTLIEAILRGIAPVASPNCYTSSDSNGVMKKLIGDVRLDRRRRI